MTASAAKAVPAAELPTRDGEVRVALEELYFAAAQPSAIIGRLRDVGVDQYDLDAREAEKARLAVLFVEVLSEIRLREDMLAKSSSEANLAEYQLEVVSKGAAS